jgi:hypothetical protein
MSIPILTQTEKFCLNFSLNSSSGHVVDIMSPLVLLQRLVMDPGSADIGTLYGLNEPGIELRWGAIMSVLVQTHPKAYPALCIKGAGSHCRG